jgi:calcineurin-like phosphoesterase family protein
MSVLFGMVERMRYFTSDTHYGHQNIIRFCDRPYADVGSMNVDLVNRAARVVEVGDELWHLGDVAFGRLDDTLTHLSRIAVDVTLVAGNHDRCHPYNGARGERFVDV